MTKEDQAAELFAARVRRKLAAKTRKRWAAERAQSKLAAAAALERARAKLRQSSRLGSSLAATPADNTAGLPTERPDARRRATVPLTELEKRLAAELADRKYRLSFVLASEIGVDEKIVAKILAAVPDAVTRLAREKLAAERWIRETYADEVTRIVRRSAPRAAVAAKPARKTSSVVAVEL